MLIFILTFCDDRAGLLSKNISVLSKVETYYSGYLGI